LEFEVTEASISVATRIPISGENWFKAMILSSPFVKDIFKPEYQANDLSKNVSTNQLIDQFERMLKIIQRYFSCEGRFNTLYHYHIRLLLHFTGKVQMNIPYYLLISIGKMAYRVQAKSKDVDSSLFHSELIRILVSEELGKKEISWEIFLVSSHFKLDQHLPPNHKLKALHHLPVLKQGSTRRERAEPLFQRSISRSEKLRRRSSLPHMRFLTATSTKVRRSSIFYQGDIKKREEASPTTEIKGKRPFTRSSIPKGDFKGQPLQEIHVQKIKGKGTKRPLEREDEIPVKDC
jgi:hypothetical protein